VLYLVKTPPLLQRLLPTARFVVPDAPKTIFLTFDDGPTPMVTPWVLRVLADYQATATFFCIGRNIARHPEIFREVVDAGHSVGNHTYDHLDGWKTTRRSYLDNVLQCDPLLPGRLFRPPFGRLTPGQWKQLHCQRSVIFWDVLSGDFDTARTAGQCLADVTNHAAGGSIVVFHDSRQAAPRLFGALPGVLEHFSRRGFRFEGLANRTGTP
jgi:peptidoglycan/xylan/chitin deacetylase (PgdA/CDA1 family)